MKRGKKWLISLVVLYLIITYNPWFFKALGVHPAWFGFIPNWLAIGWLLVILNISLFIFYVVKIDRGRP
jgi:hypothetical protein